MAQLTDKVAVVTGGTRGLGRAICAAFVREGARVVLCGRSDDSAHAAALEIDASGARCLGVGCDVADLASVRALSRAATERFGALDVWVNNAGLSAPYGPTGAVPPEHFERVLKTNILGAYHGTQAALEAFVPARRGKLINILGRGDTGAVPMEAAYSSSKYWLAEFTRTIAREHRGSGVGIFGYNPGLMTTEMLSDLKAVAGLESKLEPLRTVVRLWGNAPEVPAETVVWLASRATDGKTGLIRSQLGPLQMARGVLREGLRRVLRRPEEPIAMHVQSVPSALAR